MSASTEPARSDRTGTGTLSVFGQQLRFDLAAGFPLVTTKRVHLKSVIEELLWFLRGETNVRSLQEKGVSIWNEWADEQGELGPVYGRQWRAWATADGRHIDQIARVIQQLREDPDSRRIIVSAWNVGELDQHGACPLPLLSSVPCGGRPAVVPGLPAKRRCLPRRAVQHRLLRAARRTSWRSRRTSRSATSSGRAATAISTSTTSSRPIPSSRARRSPCRHSRCCAGPADIADYRYEDFQVLGYEPHAAIRAPVAV